MIEDYKITSYQKGIAGLSDTPNSDGLTAAALKEMFDYRSDNEIKDSINGIIDSLTGESGAENITATDREGNIVTLQAALNALAEHDPVIFDLSSTVVSNSDIEDLYQADILCGVKIQGKVYIFCKRDSSTSHTFVSVDRTTIYTAQLDNGSWYRQTRNVADADVLDDLADTVNGIESRVNNPDDTPIQDSTELISSGGVYNALTLKADSASPNLTGNPTAPTQSEGDNSTKLATTAYADRAVATETARATAAESAVALNAAPAILNTASGAVCSFADGSASPMTSVIAEIVAKQAGSGTPYPAGGGKNKLQITATTKTVSGVTFTVNADGAGNITGITANGTATANIIIAIGSKASLVENESYILTGCPTGGSASTYALAIAAPYWTYDYGSGASFTNTGTTEEIRLIVRSGVTVNNLTFQPMIRLASEADATFAPYSNIRPISGYTGANVTRAGENLLKAKYGARTHRGITFTPNADGSIKVQGTCSGGTATSSTNLFNPLNVAQMTYLPAGTYISSPYNPVSGESGVTLALNARYISDLSTDVGGQKVGDTVVYNFTEPVYCYPIIRVSPGVTVDATVYPMIEAGSTAHPYKAYNGEVFSVSWADAAGTVYGGNADAVNGAGQRTWAKMTLDSTIPAGTAGIRNISELADGVRFEYYPYRAVGSTTVNEMMSNKFAFGDTSTGTPFTISGASGSARMYLCLPAEYNTDALIRQWFTDNPTDVVYPLETPESFAFTGAQIDTLLGQNNVWNDVGGDTSAEYKADTKLYIQSLLGA